MDRIPVGCVGDDSKQYDGKVWLEPGEDIVEVNGELLSEPILPSALKEGDAVRVCQHSNGGRHKKLWSGVVSWNRLPHGELRCPTTSMKTATPQKRKQSQGESATAPQNRKRLPGESTTTPRKRKQPINEKKPKPRLKRMGRLFTNNYPHGITISVQMLQ